MIRATSTVTAGTYPATAIVDSVELDHEDRSRRRLRMTGAKGTEFLVDLPEVPALGHGDGFVLENGTIVAVAAKPERLAEFRSADAHVLARVAWHLGNRHTPAEIRADAIRIRDDYVLVEMLKKLGATEIRFVTEAFNPEGGAYGLGHTLAHDHAPRPAADPDMAAAIERRRQRQAARAAPAHVHGPDCGHDHHDHDHDQHDHDHAAHGHDHHHDHDQHHHDHARAHEHGPGCGCGHAHDHGHDHHDGHKHA